MIVWAASIGCDDSTAARVTSACGRCHITPPPDALPRDLWPLVIDDMTRVPVPDGVKPLSKEEIALAKSHYAAAAPPTLATPPRARRDESELAFQARSITPPGLEQLRLPAVANVRFTRSLSAAGRLELLVCELRTRSLMRLDPRATAPLLPLLQRLPYPAHVEIADLDGDALGDLLLVGLGDVDPSNDTRGAVVAGLQRPDGRVERRPLASGLARPSDARAADFDGDGDADIVIAAFGWRGPGRLVLLERTGDEPSEANFRPRTLDARDGFIHAEPVDLDSDSRLDIVALLSQQHEEVVAFMNRGQLDFSPRLLHKAPHPSWGYSGMQTIDLDGDGDLDVLTSNGDSIDYAALKPYHGVEWLENDAGNFRARRLASLPGCERAIASDLDADGDLDVVAVSFLPLVASREWKARDLDSVIWIERRGDDHWVAHSIERHACMHATVDVADFTGDGRPELAVGNYVWIDPDDGPRARADYLTLFTSSR